MEQYKKKTWIGTKEQYVNNVNNLGDDFKSRPTYITNAPMVGITNSDMQLALMEQSIIYNDGDIFICSDDGEYTRGAIYQLDKIGNVWNKISNNGGNDSEGSKVTYINFDSGTLAENIDNIITYVNNENGGSLIRIGFKINSNITKNAEFQMDGKMITLGEENQLVRVEDVTSQPFSSTKYIQGTLDYIDSEGNAYFEIGLNSSSNTKMKINPTDMIVTISSNNIVSNSINDLPIITYFENIDISDILLEHLTLVVA